MTNPKKVVDLLKKTGKAYCDDCLGNVVGINRHEVHTITSSLGLTAEFTRTFASCQCSTREKLVTRYNSASQNFISTASAADTDWIGGEIS
jgi:hypothetical protein